MNYDFRDIIQKEDGGIIVVAEQYHFDVKTSTSTSNGHTTTTTHTYYYYDNILVLNIDKNGVIEWQKIIPKHQVSVDDDGYYSSYVLGIKNETLYFLYNGPQIPKDKNGKEAKVFFYSRKKNSLILLTISKDGELSEKSYLFSFKENKNILVPKLARQISDDEIFIFGKYLKTAQYATIKLE